MISVSRLADLAAFYGVSVAELLPSQDHARPRGGQLRVVLNLAGLAAAPSGQTALLRRWVAHIQRERDDYAGRVLSIRRGDVITLATIHTLPPAEFIAYLRHWRALDPSSVVTDEDTPNA
jgi:hypothetical protein